MTNLVIDIIITFAVFIGVWTFAYGVTYLMEWYAVRKQREERSKQILEDLAGFDEDGEQ